MASSLVCKYYAAPLAEMHLSIVTTHGYVPISSGLVSASIPQITRTSIRSIFPSLTPLRDDLWAGTDNQKTYEIGSERLFTRDPRKPEDITDL